MMRHRLYEEYRRGGPLKTAVLRRGFSAKTKPVERGIERAHLVDLEVVAAAVCRLRGPKLTFDEMDKLADLLRSPDNQRPLTHADNMSERHTARAVIQGYVGPLSAVQVTKLRKSFQFLVTHRSKFVAICPQLFRELCSMYLSIRDVDGCPFVGGPRAAQAQPFAGCRGQSQFTPGPAVKAGKAARARRRRQRQHRRRPDHRRGAECRAPPCVCDRFTGRCSSCVERAVGLELPRSCTVATLCLVLGYAYRCC